MRHNTVIVGVGGAGGNSVNNLIDSSLEMDFIAANSDFDSLKNTQTQIKLCIGEVLLHGEGAKGSWELGKAAAEESLVGVLEHLEPYENIIFLAGFGGGTGSGALPVLAQAAMTNGKKVFCIVTTPFTFEGKGREQTANEAIKRLEANKLPFMKLANQDLYGLASEKTTFAQAFLMVDKAIANIVNDYISNGYEAATMHRPLSNLYFR